MTATSEGRPARAAEPRRAAGRAGWSKPWRGVVALVLALVVGFGGWSTWAYWSDQAALTTGSFSSGQLDLRLDGENASGLGNGYTKLSINASGVMPGESLAYPLVLNNGGNVAATYSISVVKGATWTFTDGALELRASTGTAATTAGPPRVGSCTGGTGFGSTAAVGTAPATLVTGRPLAAGSTETLCLVVSMPTGVTTANQNKTGTMIITITANQVT